MKKIYSILDWHVQRILSAPIAELDETPAPGTSPEAPGGPAEYEAEEKEEQSEVEDPDEIENAPHDRDHVGPYEFPKDDDSMM